MVPTFILTRTFAISALFVGAAPLAQAAPAFGIPGCMSRTACDVSPTSKAWSFISTIIPFKLTVAIAPPVAVGLETANNLVVLAGLDKVDTQVMEEWESTKVGRMAVEAREATAVPIIRQELYARDGGELDEREPEPDDIEERTCTYASICRREGEVVERQEDDLYAREASAEDVA